MSNSVEKAPIKVLFVSLKGIYIVLKHKNTQEIILLLCGQIGF